jgi:hypothetical protein
MIASMMNVDEATAGTLLGDLMTTNPDLIASLTSML